MPRLTEVSEDLKVFAEDIYEIEPFEAELDEEPAVLPPAARWAPGVAKPAPGDQGPKAKYRSAIEIVRAAASLLPVSNSRGETFFYRLKAFLGKQVVHLSAIALVLFSPLLLAKIVPNASPTENLLYYAVALLFALLVLRLRAVPENRIERALRKGDYHAALRTLASAEGWGFAAFAPARADVLLAAGRFADAEQWIRPSLLRRSARRRDVDLYRYARAIEGLGQMENAEKLLLIAAELLPEGTPVLALADLMLKRRGNPVDVLELLDIGLKRSEEMSREELAVHNARIAWAMTRMNELEEGERLLVRAFEAIPKDAKSTRARLLLYRAEILFDRGKRAESAASAKECLALDPSGPAHSDARLVLVAASLKESEHRFAARESL